MVKSLKSFFSSYKEVIKKQERKGKRERKEERKNEKAGVGGRAENEAKQNSS